MATSEHSRELPSAVADQQPADDDPLIRAAQAGDKAASASLVHRYWDRLYRWLYHMTHDRHAAEDLCQETFLKAFSHLDRFGVGGNFRAWLFRIAHNSFANYHRSRVRQRQPLPEDLPASEREPVAELLTRESVQGLNRAVARLPTEYRAALLLRAEEDLSFRQIAEVLGLTEDTARWRVFKARQKLLSALSTQDPP